MEVIIRPNPEEVAELASLLIAARLRAKPDLVLGLATGRTMEQVYDRLVAKHQEGGLDFSRCRTFNLDEYIGVPPEDEHSYRFYMNHHLFSRVNIDLANTHVPDGMATDLHAGAARYEQLIREAGGDRRATLGNRRSGPYRLQRTLVCTDVSHPGKGAHTRDPQTERDHVWGQSGQRTEKGSHNGRGHDPGCTRIAALGDGCRQSVDRGQGSGRANYRHD